MEAGLEGEVGCCLGGSQDPEEGGVLRIGASLKAGERHREDYSA